MFEQERVAGRLQRFVLTRPDIEACFLSGSFGKRSADAYSDLDVVFVFADEAARARAWSARAGLAQAIMPYVSLKTYAAVERRPFLQLILFANGTIMEVRYEAKDLLQPDFHDSQIKVLKDNEGWLETYAAQSAGLGERHAVLTGRELQEIDDRFWVMFWDVLRLAARGDVDKPFPVYLELLHSTLPPLLAALPPGDRARAELVQCAYERDPHSTRAYLARLLAAYRAARAAVVSRHHLQPVADEAFEREIQRQLERLI